MEQLENESPLSGEVQTVSPRQRLFKSEQDMYNFVRNIKAKRVYIEAITTTDRHPSWVVEYSRSEGEE